jgi:hypothetical protein
MSRRELTLKERQNKEAREKTREERQNRIEQLHRARLERRINREIRRDIPEEILVVDNPTYSPSPEQLRSPLHFTNLIASSEEGELVSSPRNLIHKIPLKVLEILLPHICRPHLQLHFSLPLLLD